MKVWLSLNRMVTVLTSITRQSYLVTFTKLISFCWSTSYRLLHWFQIFSIPRTFLKTWLDILWTSNLTLCFLWRKLMVFACQIKVKDIFFWDQLILKWLFSYDYLKTSSRPFFEKINCWKVMNLTQIFCGLPKKASEDPRSGTTSL